MKVHWLLRHTDRPFGPAEKLEAADYRYTISQHSTLSAARKRQSRERAEMQEACGLNAWSDHFGVFPDQPAPMQGEAQCPVCDTLRLVKFVWEPDEFSPWDNLCDSECPACRARRRGMTPEQSYTDFVAHRRAVGDISYIDHENDE